MSDIGKQLAKEYGGPALYRSLRYKAGYAAGTVEARQPREHPSLAGDNPFALGYLDALYDAQNGTEEA